MEFIFYRDAAALLEVKENTIKQAIERGVLTRAGRQGRNMLLMKEQVMLFTGLNPRTGNKKRLSLEALSSQEKHQWEEYARQGISHAGIGVAPRQDIRAIVQEEVTEQTEQIEEAFAAFLLQMGMHFRETIRPALREMSRKREVPQGIPFPVTR